MCSQILGKPKIEKINGSKISCSSKSQNLATKITGLWVGGGS